MRRTNNFLSVPCYTSARAFMERPAAEALLRAHRALARQGYGLLIHDAYRPWQITKLFWEATPDSGRMFVADPAKGSKHNRGAAVDLTLYELATGKRSRWSAATMRCRRGRFRTTRAALRSSAGTARCLREAMEAEGFTVNEYEWWHFDHRDWKEYPIIDLRFEELGPCDVGITVRGDRALVQCGLFAHQPERAIARTASLDARASRAKVRISAGSATQPSSGSRAMRRRSSGRHHQGEVPPFGQIGQLVAKAQQTCTPERTSGRERKRDGLKMGGQVDAASFFAQGGQIGNRVGAEFFDRASLQLGPAGIGEFTVVKGGRSLPFPLAAERMVENLGHLRGESIFKCASSPPDGERQTHDVVLLKSPVDVRLR